MCRFTNIKQKLNLFNITILTMDAQIKSLVERTPNDSELGRQIRAMYWANRNMNEVAVDPNQVTLDQMINEIKNS